jgi:YidC/Oxa1 family membrane protein insertase
MSDQPKGGVKFPNPQEPSMEKRLLLAFGLMALFLIGSQYLFPPPAAPPPAKAPPKQTTPAKPVDLPREAPAVKSTVIVPGMVAAAGESTFVIENGVHRVTFTNRGAAVESWVLTKFRDNGGKPLELVNRAGIPKTGRPFSFRFRDRQPATDPNEALFRATPAADGLGIDFEYSDGKTFARKSWRFRKDTYLAEFRSEVVDSGALLAHRIVWRGGFGDATVDNPASVQNTVYWDAAAGKLVLRSTSDAKDGPFDERGLYSFAGLQDQYFAAVVLPESGAATMGVETHQDTVPAHPQAAEAPHVGVALGGDPRHQWSLYVGPKDIDLLRRAHPRLEQLVDFGWFAIIAKPLFLVLHWMTERYIHNYGWSIVILTVVINFLLLPLKMTSMKSMKKMQQLQPQVAAINERYKGLSMRDPKKAQQNQEVMELYKKHGVNPMGGCMPMLLQIPFFIAFYKVLTVALELRGASWLWVTDLSRPEHLPIRILPVAMIVTQFALQKMTPTTTADPMQQRIMLLMPLMFGFMFYGVSSGLVLYWLTSNLVGIAQQWYFNRAARKQAPLVAEAPKPKQRSRK